MAIIKIKLQTKQKCKEVNVNVYEDDLNIYFAYFCSYNLYVWENSWVLLTCLLSTHFYLTHIYIYIIIVSLLCVFSNAYIFWIIKWLCLLPYEQ